MSFGPGHVVVLLIVIALVVPALIPGVVALRVPSPALAARAAARRRNGPRARPIVVPSARRP